MANLTKKELEQLLVAERKKSRAKQQQSKFMSKTLSVYGGQKKRAKEERKEDLDFSLTEFRDYFRAGLEQTCRYCGTKITLVKATSDHLTPVSRGGAFGLANQGIVHESCNWQKGVLTDLEFIDLLNFMALRLDLAAEKDMKRRLSAGGKHLANKF